MDTRSEGRMCRLVREVGEEQPNYLLDFSDEVRDRRTAFCEPEPQPQGMMMGMSMGASTGGTWG